MQISYQRGYDKKLTPVYREHPNDHWIPTIQHNIPAPPDVDGGTVGFAKWQALFKRGAEVIRVL